MSKALTWNIDLGSKGVLAAGKWRWLRALGWALFLFVAVFTLFLASQNLPQWLHLPNPFFYVSALGVPLFAFWAYAWAVRLGEKRPAVEVQPSGTTALDLLYGAVIGTAMISATLGLLWALRLYNVAPGHWTRWYDSFIFDSYISGMLEELLFRAILLRLLVRAFGAWWGLVLSALCFGAAHLAHASPVQAFEIALNGGLMMGLLFLSTGRLWMSVGMHIAWDFVEESILGVNTHSGLLLSTPAASKSVLLTGGAFGPDGSLLAALVGCGFIACTLWANSAGLLFHRRNSTLKG